MSFGTVETFKTKAALRRAVEERGAENVMVHDTSAFNGAGVVSVASLAGTSAAIVGPDVYNKRDWYANVKVKIDRKSGVQSIVIV